MRRSPFFPFSREILGRFYNIGGGFRQPKGFFVLLFVLLFAVLLFVLSKCVSPKMDAFSPAPEFDGRAGNFASYRQEVELRMLVNHLPLNRLAPALALALDKVPRELFLALGVDVSKSDTGAGEIMETLQRHFAPDAAETAFRDTIFFLGLPRPHLSLDEFLSRFRWLVEGRRRDCILMDHPREFFRPRCACIMRVSRPIRNPWFWRAPEAIRHWT